ncbi:type II toxin-antitoxin system prevent-host-death family antitoxin, partial [uncultured Boseongicola sp.]|uniref:type II toxin-antitoxin system prevent-host-death family antitoxin n=1 Tax=uncultured Boseongicola sp. TaxID=1648499 RepID=UPI00261F528E
QAAKAPVIITKHNRPSRVLIDIEEYERMKRYDTREHLTPADLTEEDIKALEDARVDPKHDQLNKLMD